MCLNDIVIARASLSDVTGILKLAQANDAEHGGMLLGHLEPEAVSGETVDGMWVLNCRCYTSAIVYLPILGHLVDF